MQQKQLNCNTGPPAKENDDSEMATILNISFASIFTDEDCYQFRHRRLEGLPKQLTQRKKKENDILQTTKKNELNKTFGQTKFP